MLSWRAYVWLSGAYPVFFKSATTHQNRTSFGLCLAVFFASCLSACQSLPSTPHLKKSLELSEKVLSIRDQNAHTTAHLSRAVGEQTATHPNLSGYYPIATGANAFAARSILSDMATTSIDVQYYIWHNDEAGQLMLKDLWEAAERGVLVRLLLDDFNGSRGLDQLLVRFANHPNIAVRLVNPAVHRALRPLNFLTSPIRTNVRMHNKSMTFDNHISIIGGRNIGNEYLNNDKNNNFADLDVLLVGAVVPKISDSFEDYWRSPLSYDIETLVQPASDDFLPRLLLIDMKAKSTANPEEQALRTYRRAIETSTIGEDLLAKQVPFRWARIDFLVDDADKLLRQHTENGLLVHKLREEFGTPQDTFSIISSYFVPTRDGTKGLTSLAHQGVDIKILTNSYDATDVGAVHAGYAHWRKDLLRAGIKLYELKSTPRHNGDTEDTNRLWRTRGQTTTSLHAKAFAVDTHKVFIGSYNVDPRSANINTEMGVVIYDDMLAERLHGAFSDTLLNQAYEVRLNGEKLEWHTIENGKRVILHEEPKMHLHDKASIAILSKLPIDWLL